MEQKRKHIWTVARVIRSLESGEFIEEETCSLCNAERQIAYPMGLIICRNPNRMTRYCEENDLDTAGDHVISSN